MTTTRTAYVNSGDLYDYRTGDYLRPATEDEERRSMEAAKTDGGAGAIEIVDPAKVRRGAPTGRGAGTDGGRAMATDEQRYYGLISASASNGGRTEFAEVLVIRRNGKQVSQEPTGVRYKTWREACADNERKNRQAAQ